MLAITVGSRRYLLVVDAAIAEVGLVLGLDASVNGRWGAAAAGSALALSAAASSMWLSFETRESSRKLYPLPVVRPPLSWSVSFVLIAVTSLAIGAYCLIDMPGRGPADAARRLLLALLLLSVGSFFSIGCFHLWRDVPKAGS